MALRIFTSDQTMGGKMFTLKERTVVSLDGTRVITPGKENGILLGPAGHRIPEAQAIALGLLAPAEAAAPAPELAPEPTAQPEDKAVKAPSRKGKK